MNYLNQTNMIFEKIYKNSDWKKRIDLIILLFNVDDFYINPDNIYGTVEILVKTIYPYNCGIIQKININITGNGLPKINLDVKRKTGEITNIKGSFLTILKIIYENDETALLNLQKTLFGVL